MLNSKSWQIRNARYIFTFLCVDILICLIEEVSHNTWYPTTHKSRKKQRKIKYEKNVPVIILNAENCFTLTNMENIVSFLAPKVIDI